MEHLTERPAELRQDIFRFCLIPRNCLIFTADEGAKYQLDMTTERDIHNQIEYSRMTGREEGREEGFRLMAEQLRKLGIAEEEIKRMVEVAKSE